MSWRWKLSVLLVLIAGFSTLIFMGHETSNQAPPVPDRVVDSKGTLLFTGNDIMAGQSVFQKYGLMDVGSFSVMALITVLTFLLTICIGRV